MGRVSRNSDERKELYRPVQVAPRMGRVSRNCCRTILAVDSAIAPRMGRVSRNHAAGARARKKKRRAPHGACE